MARTLSILTVIAGTLPAALGTTAAAQPAPPSYGFDWATIGSPGNRGANASEVTDPLLVGIGAVGYEYRMTTSKLDIEGYLEFVNAYAPYWQGQPYALALTGAFIDANQLPGGGWAFSITPGCEGAAARIEWQMAARYCNWLHNDKRTDRAAFESGAYDTSTFNFTPGSWSAQLQPSPGAKFWIPSRDEWVKAAHYDPNRNGPGQGGYWLYPDGSDEPLAMGLPQNGGETIGDLLWQMNPMPRLGQWALGQYPGVQSPWGLTDISATVPDYTSFLTNYNTASLAMGGSLAGTAFYSFFDRLDLFPSGSVFGNTLGALRIASAAPSPGPICCMLIGLGFQIRRTRR